MQKFKIEKGNLETKVIAKESEHADKRNIEEPETILEEKILDIEERLILIRDGRDNEKIKLIHKDERQELLSLENEICRFRDDIMTLKEKKELFRTDQALQEKLTRYIKRAIGKINIIDLKVKKLEKFHRKKFKKRDKETIKENKIIKKLENLFSREEDEGKALDDYLNAGHFSKNIAFFLLETGELETIIRHIKSFDDLALDKKFALHIIEQDNNWSDKAVSYSFIEHMNKFHGIDRDVAIALIRQGLIKEVLSDPKRFDGLVLDKEFAFFLAKYYTNNGIRLIEEVLSDPKRFDGLVLDKEFALHIIEGDNNWSYKEGSYSFIEHMNKFHGIDRDVAIALIRQGLIKEVLSDPKRFDGLVLDKEFVSFLIQEGKAQEVFDYPKRFDGLVLDKEFASFLIKKEQWNINPEYVNKFDAEGKELLLTQKFKMGKKLDEFYLEKNK